MTPEGYLAITGVCGHEVFPIPNEGEDIRFITIPFAKRINYGGDGYGGGIRSDYINNGQGPHVELAALGSAGLLASGATGSADGPKLNILGINDFAILAEDLSVSE